MRVAISEVGGFLRCRTAWDFGGENRMNLESLGVSPALFLGTQVHKALEQYYLGNASLADGFKTAWAAGMLEIQQAGIQYDQLDYDKLFLLGYDMIVGYGARWGTNPDEPDASGMTVLTVEHEFAVPIPDIIDAWFVGRMDGICQDREGRIWVLETKTYSQALRNPSLHLQMLAYTYAANTLALAGELKDIGIPAGTRVHGSLYNGLRKQAPSPRVTQPLFVREWVRRTTRELEIFEVTLRNVYREMSRPDVAIYPTVTRDCDWCAYQAPCLARYGGDDETFLLASGYRIRPPRGIVYQDAEV